LTEDVIRVPLARERRVKTLTNVTGMDRQDDHVARMGGLQQAPCRHLLIGAPLYAAGGDTRP
jgi:hypothetical protein